MAYSEILYEVRGAIARVTLNRPEKRNPLGPTTIGELLHALEAARADEAVRVIVLTGAGKVFSAGGDLSSMGSGGTPLQATGGAATRPGTFVDLNLALTRVGKPTIAMVNGHALAGGLGLVVACDVAIAADDAQLGTPEINVGLWPMMIMATIFRNVPRKRGLELVMTGDKISAGEAASMGLITRAVPREKLEAEVDALAQKLASKSPAVMRLGLEAFYRVQDLELEPALRHLEQQLVAVLSTEDAREGLTAFLEKRAPSWKGR
ncbi:MAG TPA: enoyl-CoA hydratase-related protein [Polyangia bacterium]|nr:enoyl-CoA hydratase-related protein [Polyangia bacterium]